MYDIFLVGKGEINKDVWAMFKHQFPNAQKLENIKSFEEVKFKSFTKFFWVVWDYLSVTDFNFDYRVLKWDEEYIHVFKNGNYFDGICIFPKAARVLQREWDYRFFTKKKEIDIVASVSRPFDIAFISYYESFAEENYRRLNYPAHDIYRVAGVKGIHQAHIQAAKMCKTDMFYVVDADAIIESDFDFNYQIPYYDFNAKSTVHVWKSRNPVNGLEYGNGGVKLLPRQMTIDMDLSKPDMTTSISKWFRPMSDISNVNGFNTDAFNTWKSSFRECCKLASRVIDRQQEEETKERLRVWCEESTDNYAIDGAISGREYGIKHKIDLEALKKINDFEWLKEQFDGRYSKN
jgi:hypothetical protein